MDIAESLLNLAHWDDDAKLKLVNAALAWSEEQSVELSKEAKKKAEKLAEEEAEREAKKKPAKERSSGAFDPMERERKRLAAYYAAGAVPSPAPVAKATSADENRSAHATLVARSAPTRRMIDQILATAVASDEPVVILGERGAGKSIVARAIDGLRAIGGYREVNMAAYSGSELSYADLFGVMGGVATNVDERPGEFELVGRGTLFLDEIHHANARIQAMLLKVAESNDRTYRTLGNTPMQFRGRIVTATNHPDPRQKILPDLWDRLTIHQVHVPALRERLEELDLIVEQLLTGVLEPHVTGVRLEPRAVDALGNHILAVDDALPGNLRQLRILLIRAATQAYVRRGDRTERGEARELVLDESDLMEALETKTTRRPDPRPAHTAPTAVEPARELSTSSPHDHSLAYNAARRVAQGRGAAAIAAAMRRFALDGRFESAAGPVRLPVAPTEGRILVTRVVARAAIDGEKGQIREKVPAKQLAETLNAAMGEGYVNRTSVLRALGRKKGSELEPELEQFFAPHPRDRGGEPFAARAEALAASSQHVVVEHRATYVADLLALVAAEDPEATWGPTFHRYIGEALHEAGDPNAAMDHLRTAVALDPACIEARELLIRALLEERTHAGQREALDLLRGLEDDPVHGNVFVAECTAEDWCGLFARYWRQEWELADASDLEPLRRAAERYGRAFDATKGHYSGVQAYVIGRLAGTDVSALGDQLRTLVGDLDAESSPDRWLIASSVEWFLACDATMSAERLLRRMIEDPRIRPTQRQARSMALGVVRAIVAHANHQRASTVDEVRARAEKYARRLPVDAADWSEVVKPMLDRLLTILAEL